ncbi:hypothetical protein NEOLEDRAFT_1054929, partial [Neolentinus lepideus HHB14362 ss-1]
GGGIACLVCAVTLSKASDIEVDVYGAAHQFSAAGAGIAMWPRLWKVMKVLGLAQSLAEVAR